MGGVAQATGTAARRQAAGPSRVRTVRLLWLLCCAPLTPSPSCAHQLLRPVPSNPLHAHDSEDGVESFAADFSRASARVSGPCCGRSGAMMAAAARRASSITSNSDQRRRTTPSSSTARARASSTWRSRSCCCCRWPSISVSVCDARVCEDGGGPSGGLAWAGGVLVGAVCSLARCLSLAMRGFGVDASLCRTSSRAPSPPVSTVECVPVSKTKRWPSSCLGECTPGEGDGEDLDQAASSTREQADTERPTGGSACVSSCCCPRMQSAMTR